MSRIAQRFAALKASSRKALIPFITAGDPEPGLTVPLMHELVRAGADVIELGVPFSDPMADGPVIQRASERALAHGVTLHDVLAMVAAFREHDAETPVVLMGYLNPIEVMGYARFAQEAAASGVDGVLTVDLPPEEAGEFLEALEGQGLDPIFLFAPTTDDERIDTITRVAGGFAYFVSVKGVTGGGRLDFEAIAGHVQRIRRATDLPVGVGFGIQDADSAARMAALADAVIVGSALVQRVEDLAAEPGKPLERVSAFLHELRGALDRASGH